MPTLDRVLVEDIEDLWPVLSPYFEAAYDAVLTESTAEEMKTLALAGYREIWTITDPSRSPPLLAAFATSIRSRGDVRWMVVEALAGWSMKDWLPLILDLERHAKAAGAVYAHIAGRMGWQRALKPLGYRPVRTVLQKDL